nr:MAG TPA: hypothetical protein [Caudoviricetes sp.]
MIGDRWLGESVNYTISLIRERDPVPILSVMTLNYKSPNEV